MANLVITSTTNCIKVVFNDLAELAGREKGIWLKNDIRFDLAIGDANIVVSAKNETQWTVSWDTGFIIDSVDGSTPTSNSDLYDLLIALKG